MTRSLFDDPLFRVSEALVGFAQARRRYRRIDAQLSQTVRVFESIIGPPKSASQRRLVFETLVAGKFMAGITEDDKDLNRCAIPLTEALWWARSVDEGVEELVGTGYTAARDADANGRCLLGMQHARNRSGHQRALAVEKLEHEVTLLIAGVKRFRVIWRPESDLPPGRASRRLEAAYKEHLQGRPVMARLDSARTWFKTAWLSWPSELREMSWPRNC
jgi:hypothetical protein